MSIFVTFRALALAELWFNVICRKAKIVNALMPHYTRIKSTDTLLFPDDSAIAGILAKLRKTPLVGIIRTAERVSASPRYYCSVFPLQNNLQHRGAFLVPQLDSSGRLI